MYKILPQGSELVPVSSSHPFSPFLSVSLLPVSAPLHISSGHGMLSPTVDENMLFSSLKMRKSRKERGDDVTLSHNNTHIITSTFVWTCNNLPHFYACHKHCVNCKTECNY